LELADSTRALVRVTDEVRSYEFVRDGRVVAQVAGRGPRQLLMLLTRVPRGGWRIVSAQTSADSAASMSG
jgi:hypothetical protein